MFAEVSFDASFEYERCFLMYLLPKVVKNYVPLTFFDSSKNFFSGCVNNKSEQGLVMLTSLPGEAVASIAGYVRS